MYDIKLLEEIGCNPLDLDLGNYFLDLTPKERETKAKVNKWHHIKLKSSAQWVNKAKRKPNDREKIFSNHISDKGFISNIYTEQHITQYKRTNKLLKKWAEYLNRRFYKEDIQMDNGHMERCSTSLIISEMQLKLQWDTSLLCENDCHKKYKK